MTDKELSEALDQNDREFASMFFNIILQLQRPRGEQDIDTCLSVNIHMFFEVCDFIHESKSTYLDLRRKFVLGEMGKHERFYIF